MQGVWAAAASGTSPTSPAPLRPDDKKGAVVAIWPDAPLPASHAELRPGEVASLSPDEISGVKPLWAEFRGCVSGIQGMWRGVFALEVKESVARRRLARGNKGGLCPLV